MRRVVLENSAIDGLLGNAEAAARLPHLLGALARARADLPPTRCGRCAREQRAALAPYYAAIKQAVPALSAPDLAALKGFLGADRIELVADGPGGVRGAAV